MRFEPRSNEPTVERLPETHDPRFFDRHAAGVRLGHALRPQPGAVALGIARGGVMVAAAVAREHGLPLDVIVVRKVGHPMQPELALGAVSAHGEAVATEHAASFPQPILRALFARARQQASSLEQRLRGDDPALDVSGRSVIVIDDGIATSATMTCAIGAVRHLGAASVTCAVPVAPAECALQLRPLCDELVVLVASRELPFAVGRFYYMFQEVTDARVRDELARARSDASP